MRWTAWTVVGAVGLAIGVAQGAPPREVQPSSVSLERQAEALRRESIARLEGLVDGETQPERLAEMTHRLAELLAQQAQVLRQREMEAYDELLVRCDARPGCDGSMLQPDLAASTAMMERAGEEWATVVSRWPRFARWDEAAHALGTLRVELGDAEGATAAFRALVRHHPQSSLAASAWLQLGELAFDAGHLARARTAYERATGFPEADGYGYALYRLAWVWANLGEADRAVELMLRVVEVSDALARAQEEGAVLLGEEALRDLARLYADADRFEDAIRTFADLQPEARSTAALRRLGAIAREQGRQAWTVEIYRRVLLADPQGPDAASIQLELAASVDAVGDPDAAWRELELALDRYGPGTSWAAEHGDAEAHEQLAKQVRELGFRLHGYGRTLRRGRRPSERHEARAADAYAAHLASFAGHQATSEVRYSLGELAYQTGDFALALEQYGRVASDDPTGPRARFCAEAAVHAAEALVGALPEPVGPGLRPAEEDLVAACDRFGAAYPDDPLARAALYRAGHVLYERGAYREAASRFRAVIARDPSSREAVLAANLILDVLAVQEDWAELEAQARFYAEQPRLGGPAFKREVAQVYRRAAFKRVEAAFAVDRDPAVAAEGYEAWARSFPADELAARALHNAGVHYRSAGRFDDAVRVWTVLADDPRFGPRTRHGYAAIASLGAAHEQIVDFARAADRYEQVFAHWPDALGSSAEQAADALHTAAVFRDALGDQRAALADYRTFVDAFPHDPRVPDMRLTAGRILEDSGDWAGAAAAFAAFAEREGEDDAYRFFARIRHGHALERLGRHEEAQAVYGRTADLYRAHLAAGGAPGAHTAFAAEGMFRQAESLHDAYASRGLVGIDRDAPRSVQDAELSALLTAKTQALQRLSQRYREVVDSGAGEWGVAALVRLGQAHEEMGEALLDSDRPGYLTDAELAVYEELLLDRAEAQRGRSREAYELALSSSRALMLFGPHTAVALERLAALDPDAAERRAERLPPAGFVAGGRERAVGEVELELETSED